MTLYALYGIAVTVKIKAFSTDSNPLINFNSVAYGGGFAYNNTGSVIYKEIFSYFRAGMNVDTCF